MTQNLTPEQQLIEDVETFCATHGLTATDFGLMALNDRAFMTRLRRGRSPTLNTAARARQFMRSYAAGAGRRRRGDAAGNDNEGGRDEAAA